MAVIIITKSVKTYIYGSSWRFWFHLCLGVECLPVVPHLTFLCLHRVVVGPEHLQPKHHYLGEKRNELRTTISKSSVTGCLKLQYTSLTKVRHFGNFPRILSACKPCKKFHQELCSRSYPFFKII